MVPNEWFSPFLHFIGIGKKNYVRAGHAAIVLINKETGKIEYYDYGRYVAPDSYGRVRSKETDHELDFQLKAKIVNDEIENLDEILQFLGTHPSLTHGEGKLLASVCNEVDYKKAKLYIAKMQKAYFIRYAVFIKKASNCSRFVTTTLIASVTNNKIRKRLKQSTYFSPSTIGNVVRADTKNFIYEVSTKGEVKAFSSTALRENIRYFLDRLKGYSASCEGSLEPKAISGLDERAQWLKGVGAGAWFELYKTTNSSVYRFKRVAPNGRVDVEGLYSVSDNSFVYDEDFKFLHNSNCAFYHIKQRDKVYRFNLIEKLN